MSDAAITEDPVLRRFRDALTGIYGDRLERVVLFGSRARGDHRPDSDYDVVVFVRNFTTRWRELGPLAEVTTDILVDTGAEINVIPYPAESDREDRPFMREIARDGIDL